MNNHHDRLISVNKSNKAHLDKLLAVAKSIEKVDNDIDAKLNLHQQYIESINVSYKDILTTYQSIRKNLSA
ncbi:MAG: hypothetical protein Hyperionvirus25_15 [Hyperionvirus sp.]|uniref:Uncharacterized protein n=1 Tax=Hyperionvirus sp. TaxID=2487770 RepID=A0A3G5AGB0_9VIRU|nr:MAG: hypothetical protein Hyperionvirus25_15 [Hyperionvirus sp.]